MARPLFLDLRCRVAAALTEGATVRKVAARFEVSVASAVRIGQLARAGQGLKAKKRCGQCPLMLLIVDDAVTHRRPLEVVSPTTLT